MKKKKTVLTVGFVLVVAVVALYFVSKGETENAVWLTSTVSRGNLVVAVSATGTLSADTTVQVGTQVSGTISNLYADFNSIVKRGEVIAQIDTTFLWTNVETARASLRAAEVAVDQAKLNYDREKKLFDRNLDSQANYDVALFGYETAKTNLESARIGLDRALVNLNYATIKAPISGVVISRNVDLGQTVAASFNTPTLFAIANSLSRMQVMAEVDEADIGSVKVGQPVTFTVDAFPNDVFK